jgi:hypothetical protein
MLEGTVNKEIQDVAEGKGERFWSKNETQTDRKCEQGDGGDGREIG